MLRTLLLLVPFLASSLLALVPSGEDQFEAARAKLKAGETEAAAELAMAVLQQSPYDLDGYKLMADIAEANSDVAGQLRWMKWSWWNRKYTGQLNDSEAAAESIAALWTGWNQDELILEEWESNLEAAAKKASGKKFYRLAGHFMDRLMKLNVGDKKLEKSYEKLADKAGQELSGGAFAAASIRRKSPQWLAKQNEKHQHWESPFERKTKHYNLNTNISWEFAETAASALDEVNEFYRSIYDYKKKARATIWCMRKRSDFDRMSMKLLSRPMPSRGVGGYWVASLKSVVAYDRSYDEDGFTIDSLWKTLFHEASHQFMSLLTKGRHIPPTWLNEGTSCYFEGCVIKADGTIVKNNPAEHRLRSWYMLDTNPKTRKSLEQLIAHPRNLGADGTGSLSYEGEYYSYGWSLVYFLLNYEENDRRVYGTPITPDGRVPDDYKAVKKAGRLVYRDAYQKYLMHFAKRGCKGDRYYALEMAKKYFVEEIEDPDVTNWEAFEARWRKFNTSLYQEQEEMGMEFADVLQARCRGYLQADDFERARITAEQADNKRAGDAETYRLLAMANAGDDREADAVFWMVRHWEEVYPVGKEQEAKAAEDWLEKNGGKDYLKLYIEPTKLAIGELASACASAKESDYPIMSGLFALHGMETLGMNHVGLEEYVAMDGVASDLRMWQAAYNKDASSNRKYITPDLTTDLISFQDDGMLINNPQGPPRPGTELTDVQALRDLRPPFEMRGEVVVDGDWGELYFGLDHRRKPKLAVLFGKYEDMDVTRFDRVKFRTDVDSGTAFMVHEQVGGYKFESEGSTRFRLEVDAEGNGRFWVNDEDAFTLPEDFDVDGWTGSFGVSTDDGTLALWKSFEVRPNRPFWPVP